MVVEGVRASSITYVQIIEMRLNETKRLMSQDLVDSFLSDRNKSLPYDLSIE